MKISVTLISEVNGQRIERSIAAEFRDVPRLGGAGELEHEARLAAMHAVELIHALGNSAPAS